MIELMGMMNHNRHSMMGLSIQNSRCIRCKLVEHMMLGGYEHMWNMLVLRRLMRCKLERCRLERHMNRIRMNHSELEQQQHQRCMKLEQLIC